MVGGAARQRLAEPDGVEALLARGGFAHRARAAERLCERLRIAARVIAGRRQCLSAGVALGGHCAHLGQSMTTAADHAA